MKIYLTHPITGLSYDEVQAYYVPTIATLKAAGYDVLSPMLGKEYLRTQADGGGTLNNALKADGQVGGPFSTNHAIVARDRWMVHQADVVYANLEGAERISIGSMFELAWAMQAGKNVVLVLGEDPNPHRHAFVLESATAVLPNHLDALAYLEKLINEQR